MERSGLHPRSRRVPAGRRAWKQPGANPSAPLEFAKRAGAPLWPLARTSCFGSMLNGAFRSTHHCQEWDADAQSFAFSCLRRQQKDGAGKEVTTSRLMQVATTIIWLCVRNRFQNS